MGYCHGAGNLERRYLVGRLISIFVMINGKAVLETLSTVPAEAIKGKIIISATSATIEEGNRMREIVDRRSICR